MLNASHNPVGLRVYCTAEASAKLAAAVLAELGLTGSQVDRLQSAPIERLIAAQGQALRKAFPQSAIPGGGGGWRPTADGKILPQQPFDPVAPDSWCENDLPGRTGNVRLVVRLLDASIWREKSELATKTEQSLDSVPQLRNEIEHFFQVYKDLDHKGSVVTRGFGNRAEAEEAILSARAAAGASVDT